MKDKTILKFAKLFSGIFSNKEQALENPKKYANIQIHIRPLLFKTFKCYAFYSEQRYQHDIWNPYRQVINQLSHEKDIFIISNHKFDNKERFTGGGVNVSLLNEISKCNLQERYGCSMHFKEYQPGNFAGKIEPGKRCHIQIGKEKTYVKSEVIVNKTSLISEDAGYGKVTGKKIWGSNFGPLVFKKLDNFDKFIESNWE